jgi:8-hydroxy-5-deazaflavin:NADPH oxidoreductase
MQSSAARTGDQEVEAMRIGVLGTGTVERTLATKLVVLGHEVMTGSRRAGNEAAAAWAETAGQLAGEGTSQRQPGS